MFDAWVTTAPGPLPTASSRGAGLERVRRALQATGGGVRLASAPGRGAAFTLTLPDPAPRRARSAA